MMVVTGNPPLATLHELNTVYSLRDLYDLIEIAAVNAYNKRLWDEHYRKMADRNDRSP
jgi:hypothetical protein